MMYQPVRQQRAFESIILQLKKAIYSEQLKPGDKLPTEVEMARLFKTSTASVRSALLNLEQAGFLTIRKGARGGFFVRAPDFTPFLNSLYDQIKLGFATISDVMEVRLLIEPQAAALAAARADMKDFENIERSIVDFQRRSDEHSYPTLNDLDFHLGIATASKNYLLVLLMKSLMAILFGGIGQRVLTAEDNQQIITHHFRILEAMKNRASDDARNLMLQHIQTMRGLFVNEHEQQE
jgi:GntR family transcriptional repressor for pyruvate dehydrogenase complex